MLGKRISGNHAESNDVEHGEGVIERHCRQDCLSAVEMRERNEVTANT